MTDNNIIKTLECCVIDSEYYKCSHPQEDEICQALQEIGAGQYDKGYSDGYKDAVKEFAKRLKDEKHICLPHTGYDIDENDWVIYEDDIDQVVEEMIGEM